jgi:all-trans-retinol 13,14-reductase
MKNLYHSNLSAQRYDAIIIGSGLGGLTTAALFAKQKRKVLVLEKHYVPGGFTHTFRRKDLTWDVGVHYVGQVNNENALMTKAFNFTHERPLQLVFCYEVEGLRH